MYFRRSLVYRLVVWGKRGRAVIRLVFWSLCGSDKGVGGGWSGESICFVREFERRYFLELF